MFNKNQAIMKNLNRFYFTFFLGTIFCLICFFSCTTENTNGAEIENKITDNELFGKFTNSSVIGKATDKGFIITVNHQDLLDEFERVANQEGIEANYTRLEILTSNLEKDPTTYGLYAFSEDNLAKGAASLILENGTFFLRPVKGTVSCVSQGCGTQCTPAEIPNNNGGKTWSCTPCSKPCTKTATVTIGIDQGIGG